MIKTETFGSNSIDNLEHVEPEVWGNVKGYEGLYKVSNKGRVKSINRVIVRDYDDREIPQTIKERILTQKDHRTGHKLASLSKDGKGKWLRVHRLVAEAFIPNPEGNPMVLHKDDDPSNNCVNNLYWGTRSDNYKDRVRNTGHGNEGEYHGMSKLSKNDVVEMRRIYKEEDYTYKDIAKKYNVSTTCAYNAISGDYWSHIC